MTMMFPERPAGVVRAKELMPRKLWSHGSSVQNPLNDDALWSYHALTRCLVELYGSASLTALMKIMREAQEQEEAVCWIRTDSTLFYPPDILMHGVDPGMVYIMNAGSEYRQDQPYAAAAGKVADILLRLHAFRCVIMDIGPRSMRMGVLSRLIRFARVHNAAIICLTTGEGHLGSLVSVRVEAMFEPFDYSPDSWPHFSYRMRAVKDRRTPALWERVEKCGHAMRLR
ncbi:MAG: hypothetical protein ACLFNQ_05025 [Spirochaetaceae bacterium]